MTRFLYLFFAAAGWALFAISDEPTGVNRFASAVYFCMVPFSPLVSRALRNVWGRR